MPWAMMPTSPEFSEQFFNDFEQLLSWRRDVRRFETTPIDPDVLDGLLASAAQYAPSVGNAQPWRFVRVRSEKMRHFVRQHLEAELIQSMESYTDETALHYKRLKLHGLDKAPEQIAVFSVIDPEEGKGLGRQTMPQTLTWSTVMAVHTLWLLARAKGIGLGWVSIIRPEVMNELLECPDDWRFVAYLCLGTPEQESQTPDLVRDEWQERLPLDRLVFIK